MSSYHQKPIQKHHEKMDQGKEVALFSELKPCGAGKKKDVKGKCKSTIESKNKKGERSPGTR